MFILKVIGVFVIFKLEGLKTICFNFCHFLKLSWFPSVYIDVLGGYNGTIFAYGQTASGKTHTMEVQWESMICIIQYFQILLKKG